MTPYTYFCQTSEKEKIYIFEKKRRQQLLFLHCSIIDANSDMKYELI